MTMKARLMALPVFVVVAFAVPTLGVAAQEQAFQPIQQFDAAVLLAAPLNLSPRVHDDWAVAGSTSLDLSPRSHDDWPLETR
jgi:hypothetical protein